MNLTIAFKMLRKTRKYHTNEDIGANVTPSRSYESDLMSVSGSLWNYSNALYHVVGSRKDMEVNHLNGKLEDEQSLVGQLQKKIKELQVIIL